MRAKEDMEKGSVAKEAFPVKHTESSTDVGKEVRRKESVWLYICFTCGQRPTSNDPGWTDAWIYPSARSADLI